MVPDRGGQWVQVGEAAAAGLAEEEASREEEEVSAVEAAADHGRLFDPISYFWPFFLTTPANPQNHEARQDNFRPDR